MQYIISANLVQTIVKSISIFTIRQTSNIFDSFICSIYRTLSQSSSKAVIKIPHHCVFTVYY